MRFGIASTVFYFPEIIISRDFPEMLWLDISRHSPEKF